MHKKKELHLNTNSAVFSILIGQMEFKESFYSNNK